MVTKHRADLPVLWGCFPLAIYFTFGSVYMSMPLSHFVPAYPSPSLCPQVHSLHLRLYSCPAPRFFRTILFLFFFRFHTYVLAYGICFSLSDLLHSVWQTLGPFTSLQITQFRFFYGWVIFHSIYVPHLLYPFICRWTLRLLLYPGYCKSSCNEHYGTWLILNYGFSQGICPVVGLLGHMVVLLLVF